MMAGIWTRGLLCPLLVRHSTASALRVSFSGLTKSWASSQQWSLEWLDRWENYTCRSVRLPDHTQGKEAHCFCIEALICPIVCRDRRPEVSALIKGTAASDKLTAVIVSVETQPTSIHHNQELPLSGRMDEEKWHPSGARPVSIRAARGSLSNVQYLQPSSAFVLDLVILHSAARPHESNCLDFEVSVKNLSMCPLWKMIRKAAEMWLI